MRPLLETIYINEAESSCKYFIKAEEKLHSYWHYHPEIEITYVKKGTGLRFIGDSIQPYQTGDLVMTGAYLPHDYISNEATESIIHVFQFSKELFSNFPECSHLRQLFKAADYGLKFQDYPISLTTKIEQFSQVTPLQQLIYLLELLNTLALHTAPVVLSSISFANKTKKLEHQDKISKVTKYILDHLSHPISLEEISNYANMSPPSFCRWFKAGVGNSFVTYLNTARIESACQQLLQTKQPISVIAYNNGFETIGHFNRVFKKTKGIAPSQYRKQRKV